MLDGGFARIPRYSAGALPQRPNRYSVCEMRKAQSYSLTYFIRQPHPPSDTWSEERSADRETEEQDKKPDPPPVRTFSPLMRKCVSVD
jgi:hypothetical protein